MAVNNKITKVASDLIKKSVKPCPRFGSIVPIVDHTLLGKRLKNFRKKNKVRALVVSEALGLTPPELSFLESGRYCWTTNEVVAYLKIILLNKK